jgi:hypothetical protein
MKVEMTTPGQAPVASVAEAAEGSHFALRRAQAYRARPQAGAVIHTHSPHLPALALTGRPLPARYEPLPRVGQAQEVPGFSRGESSTAGTSTATAWSATGANAAPKARYRLPSYPRRDG